MCTFVRRTSKTLISYSEGNWWINFLPFVYWGFFLESGFASIIISKSNQLVWFNFHFYPYVYPSFQLPNRPKHPKPPLLSQNQNKMPFSLKKTFMNEAHAEFSVEDEEYKTLRYLTKDQS